MGCWYETCEITNLPVLAGERCVMIDFQDIQPAARPDDYRGRSVKRIVKGSYSEYGDLDEYRDENYPGVVCPKGEEYRMRIQSIRGDALIPVSFRSFIKESVWDNIQKLTQVPRVHVLSKGFITVPEALELRAELRAELERHAPDSNERQFAAIKLMTFEMEYHRYAPDTDFVEEYLRIWEFMLLNRLTFVGGAYTGSQSIETDSHQQRVELIQLELEKIQQQYAEVDDF